MILKYRHDHNVQLILIDDAHLYIFNLIRTWPEPAHHMVQFHFRQAE